MVRRNSCWPCCAWSFNNFLLWIIRRAWFISLRNQDYTVLKSAIPKKWQPYRRWAVICIAHFLLLHFKETNFFLFLHPTPNCEINTYPYVKNTKKHVYQSNWIRSSEKSKILLYIFIEIWKMFRKMGKNLPLKKKILISQK